MKKTTFRGVINGTTFHSVEDYNAEIHRLQAAGVPNIIAESSSVVEEVDDLPTPQDDINWTPYFYTDSHYLDQLVGWGKSGDATRLENLKAELLSHKNIMSQVIPTMSGDTRSEFMNRVNVIIENIIRDRETTANKIKELKASLEVLDNCNPVMVALQEHYENLHLMADQECNRGTCENSPRESCETKDCRKILTINDFIDKIFGE